MEATGSGLRLVYTPQFRPHANETVCAGRTIAPIYDELSKQHPNVSRGHTVEGDAAVPGAAGAAAVVGPALMSGDWSPGDSWSSTSIALFKHVASLCTLTPVLPVLLKCSLLVCINHSFFQIKFLKLDIDQQSLQQTVSGFQISAVVRGPLAFCLAALRFP